MGKFRYYLFTYDLYKQLPQDKLLAGWGIVTANSKGDVRQVNHRSSKVWEFNINAELYYMRNRLWYYNEKNDNSDYRDLLKKHCELYHKCIKLEADLKDARIELNLLKRR